MPGERRLLLQGKHPVDQDRADLKTVDEKEIHVVEPRNVDRLGQHTLRRDHEQGEETEDHNNRDECLAGEIERGQKTCSQFAHLGPR